MSGFVFDAKYVEFMLQKAYKVTFNCRKVSDFDIGELKYFFSDKTVAKSVLYYMAFTLKDKKLAVSLEIDTKRQLNVTLNVKGTNIKVVTTPPAYNVIELEDIIDHAKFPYGEDKVALPITMVYQSTGKDPETIFIADSVFSQLGLTVLSGYIHTYYNAGDSILPPGEISLG